MFPALVGVRVSGGGPGCGGWRWVFPALVGVRVSGGGPGCGGWRWVFPALVGVRVSGGAGDGDALRTACHYASLWFPHSCRFLFYFKSSLVQCYR